MATKLLKVKKQGGATIVEMAITLPLFFLLIFAILEFALVIFTWTRAVEATRAGVRYAIVNDPVVAKADLDGLDCSSATSLSPHSCSSGCDDLMTEMNKLYPDLLGENVAVTYGCSTTGFPGRTGDLALREVTVAITGQTYNLMLPNLLGLGASFTLPPFGTTKVTEDLNTP